MIDIICEHCGIPLNDCTETYFCEECGATMCEDCWDMFEERCSTCYIDWSE